VGARPLFTGKYSEIKSFKIAFPKFPELVFENCMNFFTSAVTKNKATVLLLLEKKISSGSDYKLFSHGPNAFDYPESLKRGTVETRSLCLGTASTNNDERFLKPASRCLGSIAFDQADDIMVSGICAKCDSLDFNSASQCLAVRASSSPKDSHAGISVPFIGFQESTHTEDVKRKWRCRQIANQQKIQVAQAQLSWWSPWIHKSRCAISIMHRQK
jgi:hypothetical protein